MKKIAIVILAVVLSCVMIACGETPSGDNASLSVPNGYTKISPDEQAGVNSVGVSVEFDPHFLSQNVQKGVSESEDWQIIVDRVEKMEIDRFRVMLLPSWIEPFNDNDDTNTINWDALTTESEEMKSLYAVLDLAEANGIDVNLTLWGAEKNCNVLDTSVNAQIAATGGHFLAKNNSTNDWIAGTVFPEEFAENFSIYLQLLLDKGYTCIKEVTPCNEPSGFYKLDGSVSFAGYKALCLALQARFVKDGLRDKVLFNLSDNIDSHRNWLVDTMMELDSIADMYNSHTYLFGYNSTNATVSAWEEENLNVTRNTGKPHMVGEFGSNQNVGSSRQGDIDLYARGVLMVRQMLNFYNAGAAGASYWTLLDEYYNYTDKYASMMMLGLWKSSKEAYYTDTAYYESIKEDYEVRPQYYAFSLMTKYVQKGAEVYPILLNDDFAIGTAFKGTDGKWTYVFANGNAEGESMKLALQNGSNYGSFERYVYAENALPTGDDLIASSGTVKVSGQVLSFELAPQTVVVFTQC